MSTLVNESTVLHFSKNIFTHTLSNQIHIHVHDELYIVYHTCNITKLKYFPYIHIAIVDGTNLHIKYMYQCWGVCTYVTKRTQTQNHASTCNISVIVHNM